MAVALVVKEVIAVQGGDVDIVAAIVVVIANSAPHAIHLEVEARLFCHILEGPVVLVVIKRGIGCECVMTGPVHAVHEENVLPAVIVVVEHAHAAAHGFGKVLLPERTAVVFEMNPCQRRDIDQANRPRRARRGLRRRRLGRGWFG